MVSLRSVSTNKWELIRVITLNWLNFINTAYPASQIIQYIILLSVDISNNCKILRKTLTWIFLRSSVVLRTRLQNGPIRTILSSIQQIWFVFGNDILPPRNTVYTTIKPQSRRSLSVGWDNESFSTRNLWSELFVSSVVNFEKSLANRRTFMNNGNHKFISPSLKSLTQFSLPKNLLCRQSVFDQIWRDLMINSLKNK